MRIQLLYFCFDGFVLCLWVGLGWEITELMFRSNLTLEKIISPFDNLNLKKEK